MRKKPPIVFFNTSVILAGLYSPGGGSAKLLRLVKKGLIKGVISEIVLDEIRRRAEKIGWKNETAERQILLIFKKILPPPELSAVKKWTKTVIDTGDAHVLASAQEVKASFLVSLDKKHLLVLKKKVKKLKIVSPGELIEVLK